MANFYEEYGKRFAACKDEARKEASRQHWLECHKKNLESGRLDLIIFSAQMLSAMGIDTVKGDEVK